MAAIAKVLEALYSQTVRLRLRLVLHELVLRASHISWLHIYSVARPDHRDLHLPLTAANVVYEVPTCRLSLSCRSIRRIAEYIQQSSTSTELRQAAYCTLPYLTLPDGNKNLGKETPEAASWRAS